MPYTKGKATNQMTEDTEAAKPATLTIKWPKDYAAKNLAARITKFRQQSQPIQLDDRIAAIQFLRGVGGFGSFVLPAFYMHMAARSFIAIPGTPHWQRVRAVYEEHSSLRTLSLACRSIFDASKGQLTGRRFARTRDEALLSAAAYWAESSGRSAEEAVLALKFLRRLFQRCARPHNELLHHGDSLLEGRIGLLKFHADRAAAHITLEPYLFHMVDLVHVVAAISVIGAIITGFDGPAKRGTRYFDSVDEAGWEAAKQTFPVMPIDRLFQALDIHQQAESYWKHGEKFDGLGAILDRLPAAIGYRDDFDEAAEDTNATS